MPPRPLLRGFSGRTDCLKWCNEYAASTRLQPPRLPRADPATRPRRCTNVDGGGGRRFAGAGGSWCSGASSPFWPFRSRRMSRPCCGRRACRFKFGRSSGFAATAVRGSSTAPRTSTTGGPRRRRGVRTAAARRRRPAGRARRRPPRLRPCRWLRRRSARRGGVARGRAGGRRLAARARDDLPARAPLTRASSPTWPGSTTRRTQLALYPGRYEPPNASPRGPMQVPFGQRWRLLATFNSGFTYRDGARRLRRQRPLLHPFKAGRARWSPTGTARVDVVTWHGGRAPPGQIVLARQNLPLIVDRTAGRTRTSAPVRSGGTRSGTRSASGARASASTATATWSTPPPTTRRSARSPRS